jgi:flagellar hook-associated protein 3 FlgL
MRVTFHALDAGVEAINTASSQFIRAQEQVETGKRLRAPSDDPAAAQRIIGGKTELGAIDSYSRSADAAGSRLAVIDTVLTDMVDKITEARATVAGGMGSIATQGSRDALAAKLQGLRDALSSDINSTFRGTYIFSGGVGTAAPYAQIAGVWTYQGDSSPVTVDIASNHSVTTALDGQAIMQGSDATDVLTTLDGLVTAVQTGDQATLASGMDALQRAFDRTVHAQSTVGADQHGIEEELQRLSSFRLAAVQRVSKDEDANVASAISEMTQADTAYRAALGAVGASSKVSLIDYVR